MRNCSAEFGLALCLALTGCGNGPSPAPQTRATNAVASFLTGGASCPKTPAITKEQVEKLKEDERDKIDVFAAFGVEGREPIQARRNLAFVIKSALTHLYYSVSFENLEAPSDDPAFCAAIREFEHSAALTADGVLTLGEFGQLSTLAEKASETRIIPQIRTVYSDGANGYVSAEGTWVMQGEPIAWPINTSSIVCLRRNGNCIEFSVSLIGSGESSPSTMASSVQFYDITRWTADQVDARSEALCAETKLTINTQAKTAFSVTAPLNKAGCKEFDDKIGVAPEKRRPRLSTLEGGFGPANEFYTARHSEAEKAFSPAVREIVAKMKAANKPPS